MHDHPRTQDERRSNLRVPQPRSTSALRPSQRRAAEHRAERDRERAVERWLRLVGRR